MRGERLEGQALVRNWATAIPGPRAERIECSNRRKVLTCAVSRGAEIARGCERRRAQAHHRRGLWAACPYTHPRRLERGVAQGQQRDPDDDAERTRQIRDETGREVDALYREYAQDLKRIVSSWGGVQPATVEDIVQTSFNSLYLRMLRQGPVEGEVRAYINTIAKNAWRREYRRRRRLELTIDDPASDLRRGLEGDLASEEEFERILESYDNQDVLLAAKTAIAELPRHLREVYVLHELFGWSKAKIAEYLGKSQGAVRADLHHARKRVNARTLEILRAQRDDEDGDNDG